LVTVPVIVAADAIPAKANTAHDTKAVRRCAEAPRGIKFSLIIIFL
jgi:hypothetical protein